MPQNAQQPELPVVIRTKLDALRTSIRRYVWCYGIAVIVCAMGVAFWVTLVLDWFFEPTAWVRVVMQLAVAGTVAGLFYGMVVDRLRRPLTDANMALLLERHFPELGDRLLTVLDPNVEATPGELDVATFLYRQVNDQVIKAVGPIDVRQVFDYTLLRRSAIWAGILWLLIAIFTVLFPGVTQVWAARVLGLSSQLWPRHTRLELVGVEGDTMKVARGDDLEIIVGADLSKPRVPQTVRIERHSENGGRETKTMTREGEGVIGRDTHQLFTHTFHAVREPFIFFVEGGDADLGPIRVVVVESPTVESMTLRCSYPDYMAKQPRDVKVIGPMAIPRGTKIQILGRSAKPLTGVEAERIGGGDTKKRGSDEDGEGTDGESDTKVNVEGAENDRCLVTLNSDDPHCFQCELAELTDSASYRFTLHDTDGIQGREPFVLTLSATEDEPPELPTGLYGIGSVVTSRAYLPVRGRATDDYGIARVWFDYTIDPEKKGEVDEASQGSEGNKNEEASTGPQGPEKHGTQVIFETKTDSNPTELALDATLDLEPFALQPGQTLAVTVLAVDRCSLGAEPNVGSGSRRALEVVTPERLLILLQARELIMRQRFEAILGEVNDTREILVRLDFVQKKEEGQKLQDELGVRRAIENCRKNAEETRAVTEVFDDIRLQMIHNRIDSAEATERLASGVVAPLREVVERRFPELEREIEQLLTKLTDPKLGPQQRDVAVTQLDALLEVMNGALARMLEMEDYNELIKILRRVIDDQQDIDRKIRERRKASLQDLLED